MKVNLVRANAPKKWKVVFPDGSSVSFGAKGYEDFTTTRDQQKKENYLKRHSGNEDWTNYRTAGFWSRWLLWNKPTLTGSIADVRKRFQLNINKDG